jgi:glycerophosphoryl diester phosphodiesterase
MILFLGNCSKKEDYKVTNINHNTLMILGHRGMGEHFQFPGNTLEAIKPVLEIGADGCEIDIQITKDSVLVLFHNDKLEGKTNCGGKIYDYNWEEIKNCTYSGLHSEVKLISVEELFNNIENLNEYYFSFDCKLNIDNQYDIKFRKTFLNAIKLINEKYNMSRNIFLEGDLGFLILSKELGLDNKGFLIGNSVDEAIKNNIFGIGASLNTSADTIKYAHNNGIYVMMWGAKTDLGNKQALKLNPDILQTDKPIPLLMLFDRMNYDPNNP